MPTTIVRFHETYPHHQVQLATGTMEDLVAQVADGRLDMAAGAVSVADASSNLAVEPLTEIEWGILAAEDHPLAKTGQVVPTAELARYPFLSYRNNAWLRASLSRFFGRSGHPPPMLQVETDSLIAGLELVRSGAYLMLEAIPIVRAPVGYRLVALRTETRVDAFSAGMIFRGRSRPTRALQFFRSSLVKTIRSMQRAK